ncbi:hypothetical protein Bca52824_088112 [Brassica carinata]|uniref:Uncharacterized protein n=1 Tax=Brassica carinata TaxID=52824 RepID=A0A8X7PF01_BRACI|nr:hypothetical protein Bca52824_088112 [Brassica carinata]
MISVGWAQHVKDLISTTVIVNFNFFKSLHLSSQLFTTLISHFTPHPRRRRTFVIINWRRLSSLSLVPFKLIYSKAIQSNPAAGEAWKRRGQARAALGEFAEAVEDLTRALELEPKPKSPDILHERCIIKDFTAGVNDLSICLKQEKDNKSAYTYLGLSFASLGEYIKAEEAHLKSIQLDSNYLEAWLHLAQFYQELADYSKALECIDQALQVDNKQAKKDKLKNSQKKTEEVKPESCDVEGADKGLKRRDCEDGNELVAVSQLRNILGLGTREAEAISVDFTSKAYRKRLAIHEGCQRSNFFWSEMVTNAETRKSVRKAAHGLLRLSERLPCLLLARLSVGFSQTIYQTSKSGREPQRVSKGAQEDDCLESLRKTRPDKELAEKMGKPGQTEITLKNDLPERDRIDLYKTILALLSNRRGLAEQEFRQQAAVILADGQLTKARVEQLDELQKQEQVGLPQPLTEKVIKNITTTKMANAKETAVNQGRQNIKQIRESSRRQTIQY